MRDHRNVGVVEPLPRRLVRVELQPGGAKGNVIWLPPTAHPIHAVGDPVESTVLDELGKGTCCHAGVRSLAPSHESPLIIGDGRQALEGVGHAAKYTAVWILCSTLSCATHRRCSPAAAPCH